MTAGAERWARLMQAQALLAVDPTGLGGLWLQARIGPVRDAALAALSANPLPHRRLHPGIGDDALYGAIDLAATLAGGGVVRQQGLLARPALLLLTMAERCPPGLAARLAAALDSGDHALVALDEGTADDPAMSPALTDRLAFHADLAEAALADLLIPAPDPEAAARARALLPQVKADPAAIADLVQVAARLGIASPRAPLLALRAARAAAALAGRTAVNAADLTLAVELVLAPRATQFPEEAAPPPPPAPDDSPNPDREEAEGETSPLPDRLPEDLLVAAAAALLPADLLARIAVGRAARGARAGSGAGARQKGNRRGRPLPARPGRLDGTARIDLVATLRTAAPWQGLRRQTAPNARLLHIRPADIRLRRFEQRSDRLLILAVDASGSAAFARLAEAKGAVELLLGQAYARRDHVALIGFRGTTADLMLPPTRSLVQTKRRLAEMVGGGGTPLAAGLRAVLNLALAARARGLTPALALMTDGRANVALDGQANRAQAGADASAMARLLAASAVPGLVIDTGTRPEAALQTLAATLGAPYMPLPRADAARLAGAVSAALG